MEPTAPRRLMTPYGVVMTLVFAALWIGPICWVGATSTDVRFMPRVLKQQHRIACLFPNAVQGWKTYHIEVQTGGQRRWAELPLTGYFDMGIFGHRTRLHRLMSKAYRRPGGVQRTRAIADFVRARYGERHPAGPALDAVRFVRVYHPVEKLAKEKGAFRRRPLAELGDRHQSPFGEVRFDGRPATHPGHRGPVGKGRLRNWSPAVQRLLLNRPVPARPAPCAGDDCGEAAR